MIIENQKNYCFQEAEQVFFRPTFCGKSIEEMGVRVIYNLPVPTIAYLFSQQNGVLKAFSSGWQGGEACVKEQVEISMNKVKAESAYSAEEYFNTVFELVTSSADVNIGDLTGTDLEKAETELFRRAIAEGIYSTMWLGDICESVSSLTTFNGFFRHLYDSFVILGEESRVKFLDDDIGLAATDYLSNAWCGASHALRALVAEGQLAYYVSSDLYDAYQRELDNKLGGGYNEMQVGRPRLYYHGIPIIEVPLAKYQPQMAKTFCLLTDRRNLVLAINTKDTPENEVRMWHNPDEMENRQRAVFLAGTAIIDQDLVSGMVLNVEGSF